MVSEKQKAILTKNGYTSEQIVQMDYQKISKVIGEILAKNQPKETPVNVENDGNDKLRSMKVSYAKDIAIAMIHELALLKVDFRQEEVMKAIVDNSVNIVGALWSRL